MNLTERQKCATLFYNEVKNLVSEIEFPIDTHVVWEEADMNMDGLCRGTKSYPCRKNLQYLAKWLVCLAKQYGLADIDPFIDNALAEMERKGHDYADDDNAYQNFEETAEMLGLAVPQVIMVSMLKHWAALNNYRNGKIMQGDPIVTKFMDVCNYCAILDAWLREQSAKEKSLSFFDRPGLCDTMGDGDGEHEY